MGNFLELKMTKRKAQAMFKLKFKLKRLGTLPIKIWKKNGLNLKLNSLLWCLTQRVI